MMNRNSVIKMPSGNPLVAPENEIYRSVNKKICPPSYLNDIFCSTAHYENKSSTYIPNDGLVSICPVFSSLHNEWKGRYYFLGFRASPGILEAICFMDSFLHDLPKNMFHGGKKFNPLSFCYAKKTKADECEYAIVDSANVFDERSIEEFFSTWFTPESFAQEWEDFISSSWDVSCQEIKQYVYATADIEKTFSVNGELPPSPSWGISRFREYEILNFAVF